MAFPNLNIQALCRGNLDILSEMLDVSATHLRKGGHLLKTLWGWRGRGVCRSDDPPATAPGALGLQMSAALQ